MASVELPTVRQVGTWGKISTWVAQADDNGRPVKHKSQAKFRDHDGHARTRDQA